MELMRSREMLDRETKKDNNAGADGRLQEWRLERAAVSDGQFDAVLSTLMLHHLGRKAASV